MERSLSLSIELRDGEFQVFVFEPESGECADFIFPFSPDEHPEFDKIIGNEIYSWISLWMETKDDELDKTERDRTLERLWEQFEDIPMNPETECIEEQFLGWWPGTKREEIWHWFDEQHSKGVAYLLYEYEY